MVHYLYCFNCLSSCVLLYFVFISVDVVKKKWQSLRDVFRREYNKFIERRSGDEAPLENASAWPHFKAMLFLKDTIEHRRLHGNISPSKNVTSRTADFELETSVESGTSQESELASDTSYASSTSNSLLLVEGSPQQSTHDSQSTHCPQPSVSMPRTMEAPPNPSTRNISNKRKRRADASDDPFLAKEIEKLKLLASSASLKEDSDYMFLMSLLPYLKNVPIHRKLAVRHKLQQVFLDEEQRPVSATVLSYNVSPQSSTGYMPPGNTLFRQEEQSTPRFSEINATNMHYPDASETGPIQTAEIYLSNFPSNNTDS